MTDPAADQASLEGLLKDEILRIGRLPTIRPRVSISSMAGWPRRCSAIDRSGSTALLKAR